MFSRDKRGERRVSQPVYKLLLAAHVVVSGAWLGIAFAKIILGVAAATSEAPATSRPLYLSMEAVNVAFPPTAIATLVTGLLLSMGTKWGLLEYYWVATKLALTVGVVVTGVALVDRLIRQSISAPSVGGGPILSAASAPTALLISLSAAHVIMLGVATVLSVYKPLDRTPFGRYKAPRPSRGEYRA
jgi:hypothetical protein